MLNNISDISRSYYFTLNALEQTKLSKYWACLWDFVIFRAFNMGVIPNPKMAFIFPISCILAFIFPILIKYFPKFIGKGSFLKSHLRLKKVCPI